jgi:hypothetical protein
MNAEHQFNSFNSELASGRLKTRVYGLLVNPIIPYSDGRFLLPPIQRSSLDFRDLGSIIGGTFGRYGDVCLRIANDYVDAKTFDNRSDAFTRATESGLPAPDLHFKDYGAIVRRHASRHAHGVIDVQSNFDKLRGTATGDRLIIPPEIIPIWVAGRNVRDTADWFVGALDCLGISPLTNLVRAFKGKPPIKVGPIGRLPVAIGARLADMFGMPFEEKASFIQMTT